MATDLTRISEKARKEPKLVFTSLYHHMCDVDNLRAGYDSLEARKAPGVDGVTKAEYGKHLEENLRNLSIQLKRMGYRPGPKRRSYILKEGNAKGRPLGLSNLEDKIVEAAVKRTLEPIYEAVFEDSSYGYRPGRNQHRCLDALGRTIQQKRINYIVEADLRRFFDTVNHAWMVKFLRHRIGDERVIRLIIRMLKSGIMEDGLVHATEEGTPQGSILSPLLSNVYLHYVLDLWFSHRVRQQCRGQAYYFRFADDFVACFQYKSGAAAFRQKLAERVQEFGYFKVKRRTSRKKLGQSLRKFTDWARTARTVLRKGEMLRQARTRVNGYLNYYAITDNSDRCSYYVYCVERILFKWLNRKSQRRAYTWPSFRQALACIDWPTGNIRKGLNPCRRTEAEIRLSGSGRGRRTTGIWKRYCGTVAKVDGKQRKLTSSYVPGVSCLLTKHA